MANQKASWGAVPGKRRVFFQDSWRNGRLGEARREAASVTEVKYPTRQLGIN